MRRLAFLAALVFALNGCTKKEEPKWKRNSAYDTNGNLKSELNQFNRPNTAKKAIRAGVVPSRTSLRVHNFDDYDWPETTIYVNGIVSGYRLTVPSIKAHETVEFPLDDFTTRDGKRFNPQERAPKEVVVSAKGFDGRQFNF